MLPGTQVWSRARTKALFNDEQQYIAPGLQTIALGLNRDGSIKSVDVIDSSGHKLLDDAAQRIVRLAGPFPRLPPDKTRVDELYITRTWQFLPGDILRNR